MAIASVTALLCGVAPAVQFWTRSIERPLRAGGRSSTGAGARFRSALVVGQTALAVVLLVGNGLLIRSFTALLRVDLGYRVDRRVALTTHVWGDYPQPERRAQFFAEVEQRIAREPGVMSVGAASALPLSHEGSEMDPPFTVGGRATPAPGDEPTALVTFVTPGYFQTIGMRLVAGRLLTDEDSPSSPPVVVVNETMARRIWPGESAIGNRITSRLSFSATATREVVGIVGDVRQGGLSRSPAAGVLRAAPAGAVRIDDRRRARDGRRSLRRPVHSARHLVRQSSPVVCRRRDARRPVARHAGAASIHVDAAVRVRPRRHRARVGRALRCGELLGHAAHLRKSASEWRSAPGCHRCWHL